VGLDTAFEIIHVIVALFMILVVLVQGGHGGGVGAAFGGGSSSGVFGATGATSLLGKLTYGAAAVFMVTSIVLTVLQGTKGDIGLEKALQERAAASATPAPSPEASALPVESPVASPTPTP
jgi:preprotein translocase subunit SecG